MTGEANVGIFITAEDIIQQLLRAEVLCCWNFCRNASPQQIIFRKAVLKTKLREIVLDP